MALEARLGARLAHCIEVLGNPRPGRIARGMVTCVAELKSCARRGGSSGGVTVRTDRRLTAPQIAMPFREIGGMRHRHTMAIDAEGLSVACAAVEDLVDRNDTALMLGFGSSLVGSWRQPWPRPWR